jgi:hypothetical protein
MLPNPPELTFELFLFHREVQLSCTYLKHGVSAIIIDLEHQGKHQRQAGFDTEINAHTIDDLRHLRAETEGSILCRISGPDASQDELLSVAENGADEIIIPMVRSPSEVERIIRQVGDTCRITVMIETVDAVKQAEALCALPIDRVYVGLNDLRIERNSESIFAPMTDGLLTQVRQHCLDVEFGFGGLTLPERGTPLPARHLYAEMSRLDCTFTFLRRSFYQDITGLNPKIELQNMQRTLHQMRNRTEDVVETHLQDMIKAIEQINGIEGGA